MKTTVDLPDDLLYRAKVVAAQRKTTLKELVITGLDQVLRRGGSSESEREKRARKILTALHANNTEPMVALSRDEIYDRHLQQ